MASPIQERCLDRRLGISIPEVNPPEMGSGSPIAGLVSPGFGRKGEERPGDRVQRNPHHHRPTGDPLLESPPWREFDERVHSRPKIRSDDQDPAAQEEKPSGRLQHLAKARIPERGCERHHETNEKAHQIGERPFVDSEQPGLLFLGGLVQFYGGVERWRRATGSAKALRGKGVSSRGSSRLGTGYSVTHHRVRCPFWFYYGTGASQFLVRA